MQERGSVAPSRLRLTVVCPIRDPGLEPLPNTRAHASHGTFVQDPDFPSLSGARIVRIAVHPELPRAGYGSRCVELLKRYYQGQLVGLDSDEEDEEEEERGAKGAKKGGAKANGKANGKAKAASESDDEEMADGEEDESGSEDEDGEEGGSKKKKGGKDSKGSVLLTEKLAPRAGLPPLLVSLQDRKPERLHYLGVSYGLTQQLFNFWRKAGFQPLYVRQSASDTTGEHTIVMVAPLEHPDVAGGAITWLDPFVADFKVGGTVFFAWVLP